MLLHISTSHIVVMLAQKLNWLKILNQCMCNESSLGFRLLWIFTFRPFKKNKQKKPRFYCWDLNVTGPMKCNILFLRYYTETSPICHSSVVNVMGNQSEYFWIKAGVSNMKPEAQNWPGKDFHPAQWTALEHLKVPIKVCMIWMNKICLFCNFTYLFIYADRFHSLTAKCLHRVETLWCTVDTCFS